MKQLLQDNRSGMVRLEDVPAPTPRDGAVLVRSAFSLLSAGTERAAVSFAQSSLLAKARRRPDLVRKVAAKAATEGPIAAYQAATRRLAEWQPLGYSSAGVVVESGAGVDGFAPGDRVACAGGGYATHSEFVSVPRNLVARVPDGVALEDAAFTTLGAIALHGVHRAEAMPGERVGVIGLGLLGLLTTQILNAYGHPVMGFDLSPEAVERALALSADDAMAAAEWSPEVAARVDAFTGGHGLDAVIITAATPSDVPVNFAGEACREGGSVCVVGDVGMAASRRLYYEKELRLSVARSYGPGRHDPSYEEDGLDYPIRHARWTIQRNMEEVLRLLASRRLRVAPLVARTVPFDEAPTAYEALVKGNVKGGTILFRYPQRASQQAPSRSVAVEGLAPPAGGGRVGIGVVGAGTFAQATLLPALARVSDADRVVIAAAGGTRAAQAARSHGFARATSDAAEVLSDPRVNAVIIATRHDQHAALAARALAAGKDVLVEKPLALSREELEDVLAAARPSSRRLLVGFNRRFAPMVEDARRHFEGRRGPLLMHCRVNAGKLPSDHWLRDPLQGGGRILGEVCHFVDLLHHFAGSAPTRVYASGGGSDGTPADDHVSVTIDFADGSRGTIHYSGDGPDGLGKERIELLGAGRSAILDNYRSLTLTSGTRSRKRRALSPDKGHGRQLEAFVDAVRTGKRSPVPLRDLALSTLATLAVVESLAAGAPVPVEQPPLENLGEAPTPGGTAP